MTVTAEITEDAVFHGALRLAQRRGGYRFTEDAVLLAAFAARGGPAALAADLGAGCGVVGLILARAGLAGRVLALEIQPGLARLVARNAGANGLGGRVSALRTDLRSPPLAPGRFDLVVSNPPYLPVAAGRPSPSPERALARHELACAPADLARAAALCLGPSGRVAVVYPAARLAAAREAMVAAGLSPTRERSVLPGPGRAPSLALLEARREPAAAGPAVEPDLVARDPSGRRSAELRALLAGDLDAWARP